MVRVVHAHRGLLGRELVGEGLARLDRVLGVGRHAVHGVRDPHAVEVEGGRLRQLVGEHDPDLVADLDLDGRGRDHAVVGPRLDDLPGLDLPVDDLRGQIELLRAVGQHRRGQVLATVPRRLGRVLVGDGLHDGVHLLGAHRRRRRGGRSTVRPAVGGPGRSHVEHPRHAARGVPCDRADHLVGALGQRPQIQLGRLTGRDVCGLLSEARERDVVSLGSCVRQLEDDRTGTDLGHGRLELEIGQRQLDHGGLASGGRRPTPRRCAAVVVVAHDEEGAEGQEQRADSQHDSDQ